MRRFGRVAAGVVGVAVAIGLAVMATAALAGTPGTLPGNGNYVGGVTFPGPEPLVLWNLPGSGGRLGTCIEANVNGPLTGPYQRQTSVTDPIYAELNHLYAVGSTSDVRLAELSALNSAKYDQVDKTAQWAYVQRGDGGLSVADATAMMTQARNLAGPYSVTISWPATDTKVGVPYQATVTVRSASGMPVPRKAVRLTGTNVTLSQPVIATGASGVATVGFTIAAGTSATATISAVAAEWLTVDRYSSSAEQTMLVTGPSTLASGVHSGPIDRARDVGLVKVAKGDTTHTPVPGYVFRVTAADGSVVLASVTTGLTPTSLGALPVGATYTVTEIATPPGGALYLPPDASITFTVPAGVGQWDVEFADPAKPTPALHTQASPQRAVVGQRLVDHVTVSGDDGEGGTIAATVFGPVRPPQSGQCSDLGLAAYRGAPAARFTATVSGNGVVDVTGPTVTQAGCYGWAETLTLTPSGVVVNSPPTAPGESLLVTQPSVRTVASAPVALPGTRLHDRVTVSGLGDQSALLTATLYGPLPVNAVAGCDGYDSKAWQNAVGAKTSLVAGHASAGVHGDGTHDIGDVLISKLGCYTWVETLTPGSPGASPVRTPYGQPGESTVVIAPALGTVASPAHVRPGGSLRDVITVVGIGGVKSSITGRLLGPIPPADGSCADLDWTHAPTAGRITPMPVHKDGRYLTAPIAITDAGCYTFSEELVSITVPPAAPLAVTKPGQPGETVLVLGRRLPLAITGVPLGASLTAGLVLLGLGALGMALGSLRRWAR